MTLLAVSPTLALTAHNSVSPCVSVESPELPSIAGAQGECLGMRVSVHGPFKWMLGFLTAFHLTCMDRIPVDFHTQML